ncbi:MAG: hypothetical protein ACYDB3_06840 [Acidimicrobiales bacterium]
MSSSRRDLPHVRFERRAAGDGAKWLLAGAARTTPVPGGNAFGGPSLAGSGRTGDVIGASAGSGGAPPHERR